MMTCPDCGTEMPTGTDSCPECGADMTDVAPDAPEVEIEVSVSVPVGRAALLKGTSERRGISRPFEVRETSNGLLQFNGYAAVWDQPYTVHDWMGSFTEIIDRKALNRSLSRNPNVVLNINHGRDGGLPLARTASGTMRLAGDNHGLLVDAGLDLRNPKVQELQSVLDRRDTEDMSWAFRVAVDEWTIADNGEETRLVKEANIDGGDVSVVDQGANPGTTANPLRSALADLADFDRMLVECRSGEGIDKEVLRAAHDTLGRLLKDDAPARKTMSLAAARRALELD